MELKTNSKMFCGCSTKYFGDKPNTHTCPVCLGLPGALPVPNKKAVDWCLLIGMGLNCEILPVSKFDRKNYFYPDLAKGYQISQYDQPFCQNGYIKLLNGKTIRIRRVHMEEDTGKLIHEVVKGEEVSLIDFNRSGIPLVEIVTEPDFESSTEVKEYLQYLQQIVRYLGVSGANMEKGEMRLEPNISLRKADGVKNKTFKLPSYKVEVKNINSFKFVEKAIEFELKRQQDLLENDHMPVQETRGWDENRQKTFSQRIKEEAKDYRYFPEPDIPPIRWKNEDISKLKKSLPELPGHKLDRFINFYGLPSYDAEILTREKNVADYYEETVQKANKSFPEQKAVLSPRSIANWIINKKINIDEVNQLELINQIVKDKTVEPIDEILMSKMIDDVIRQNEKAVEDYKKGKTAVIMFLVGQVMKKTKGKNDANTVRNHLEKRLK